MLYDGQASCKKVSETKKSSSEILRKKKKKSFEGVKAKKIVAKPRVTIVFMSKDINPFAIGDDGLEKARGTHLATIKINISSNAVVNVVDDRGHMEKKSDGKMNQIAEPKQM